MQKMQPRSRTVNPALWLALAAAGTAVACQGDQQPGDQQPEAAATAEPEAAATAEPVARGSAVHGEQPAEPPHATAEETMEIGYACADDKTFTIAFAGKDQLLVRIDGEAHTLDRTEGHVGMLFSKDDIVFMGQGREASVEIDGVPTFVDCQAQGHP